MAEGACLAARDRAASRGSSLSTFWTTSGPPLRKVGIPGHLQAGGVQTDKSDESGDSWLLQNRESGDSWVIPGLRKRHRKRAGLSPGTTLPYYTTLYPAVLPGTVPCPVYTRYYPALGTPPWVHLPCSWEPPGKPEEAQEAQE